MTMDKTPRRHLYVLRHGVTRWNEEKKIVGHTDLELSDKGRQQASRAQRLLAHQPLHRALTSPLTRTSQTAEIALEGKELDATPEPRLIELALAGWEGRSRHELRDDEHWQLWLNAPDQTATPEGERLEDVRQRAVAALRDGLRAIPDDGGLLIVTHGGVARVLILHLLGMPLSAYQKVSCDCASISAFEVNPEGGLLKVLGLNIGSSRFS